MEKLRQWHKNKEVWLQYELVSGLCFQVRIVDRYGVPLLRKVKELYSFVVHITWQLKIAVAGPEDMEVQRLQKGGLHTSGWEGLSIVPRAIGTRTVIVSAAVEGGQYTVQLRMCRMY